MSFAAVAAQLPGPASSIAGWIAAVIVAVFSGGGFGAMLTARATRRSLDTDSLRKVADATVILLDPMRAEIQRLESRVQKLSVMVEEATAHYEQAEARARSLTAQATDASANYSRALQLLREHDIPLPWESSV
ncbi:MAG TPA: hypothetical protein VK887_04075 [Pseudonocardiaceae bacterium]|nr:hypothetical protein [Pseudonocardiaceae bacterium]